MKKKAPEPTLWSIITVAGCVVIFAFDAIFAFHMKKYLFSGIGLIMSIYFAIGFIGIFKRYMIKKNLPSRK